MPKADNKTYKEAIEHVYELTKDGYTGTMVGETSAENKIRTFLQNKGVIIKTKEGKDFTYTWNKELYPPTALFIKNTMTEIRRIANESTKRLYAKKHSPGYNKIIEPPKDIPGEKRKGNPLEERNLKPTGNLTSTENLLAHISDKELWNELKRRGYAVKDSRLIKTIIIDIDES